MLFNSRRVVTLHDANLCKKKGLCMLDFVKSVLKLQLIQTQ